MCKWHGGTYEGNLRVDLANGKWCSVDACIQPLVQALNDGGVLTIASCCGHGQMPGTIALADGRWLMVVSDGDERRRLEAGYEPLCDETQERLWGSELRPGEGGHW